MEYIILLIALAGIVVGADLLVAGAVSIARKFKVSDFVIGAAIVGVGTSMPELVVSFIGAVKGNADVAIGNVVGSNIFNVLGILGLTALLFPIAIDKANMKFEIPLCIGVSIILTILAFNFVNGSATCIDRLDGLALLAMFTVFMWYSFYRDKKNASAEETTTTTADSTPICLAIVKVLGGLAILITSCDFFVDNAITVAKSFGVSDAIISLTLIACGTSLPELAASIAAVTAATSPVRSMKHLPPIPLATRISRRDTSLVFAAVSAAVMIAGAEKVSRIPSAFASSTGAPP